MNNLRYWLLWAALALVAGGWLLSCAVPRHAAEAPPRVRRHYQQRQRLHHRQRTHHISPPILWN